MVKLIQKNWLLASLSLLLLTLVTLNAFSKVEAKENIITNLAVGINGMKKLGDDSLLEMSFCNKSDSEYFIENRFIFSLEDKTLVGLEVFQDEKELDYLGRSNKKEASKFPDDYVAISPKDCITYSVMLNKFFDFKQDNEIVLSYFIMNSNPLTDELDEISFDDKKITIGK